MLLLTGQSPTTYINMHRHTDDPGVWVYNSRFTDVESEVLEKLYQSLA